MSEAFAPYGGMSRPDPATDLIGYLRWLGDKLESMEEGRKARRVSASEAARNIGHSESYFRGKPWRIPGFGATGTMHSMTEWEAWLSRPEAERRQEWDTMGVKARKKIAEWRS